MEEMININIDEMQNSSIIKVIGVGGAGCNAVNHMYEEGIHDVDFIICNTDAQALIASPIKKKIQLGVALTGGRGAGNLPEQGRQAAVENVEDVREALGGQTKMVFVTAGMGGGTGTGAAPVVAELAKSLGILTIAVVSVPSIKEGKRRHEQALAGVEQMREHVDSMLVISNDKLHRAYGDMPASKALKQADSVITTAVKGVAEIITVHGNINIDFADVNTVMENSKVFIMGTGRAEGEGRAMAAVKQALESPLLDSNDIRGSEDILLNIISGNEEVTIDEVGEILDHLQDEAGDDTNIIWGNGIDSSLGNEISVTVVATRFSTNPSEIIQEQEVERVQLPDLDEEPDMHKLVSDSPRAEVKQVELLDDEEPEYKPRKKTKKLKLVDRKEVEETSQENWFKRAFNSLFDEGDDAPMED
ncbi:MAG: cell division protein FtsZ [Mangrovibacterium sp.]